MLSWYGRNSQKWIGMFAWFPYLDVCQSELNWNLYRYHEALCYTIFFKISPSCFQCTRRFDNPV